MMLLDEVVTHSIEASETGAPVTLAFCDVVSESRQEVFQLALCGIELALSLVSSAFQAFVFGHVVVAPAGCVRTPTVAGAGMAAYSTGGEQ